MRFADRRATAWCAIKTLVHGSLYDQHKSNVSYFIAVEHFMKVIVYKWKLLLFLPSGVGACLLNFLGFELLSFGTIWLLRTSLLYPGYTRFLQQSCFVLGRKMKFRIEPGTRSFPKVAVRTCDAGAEHSDDRTDNWKIAVLLEKLDAKFQTVSRVISELSDVSREQAVNRMIHRRWVNPHQQQCRSGMTTKQPYQTAVSIF